MAARIIHFGTDSCSRLLVLEHAGYDVDDCPSLIKLDSALAARRSAAAVLMTEDPRVPRREAITLVRSRSSAPLILFQTVAPSVDELEFDLVIPVLTPPREWLEKIAAIIERSRSIIADSKSVREQSVALRQQASVIRRQSALERERSAREHSRIDELTRQHREEPAD
jgi:hypothetical protein